MSLHPGNFAVIKYSCYEINIGNRVEILRLQAPEDRGYVAETAGLNFWFVRADNFFYSSTVEEYQFWVEKEFVIAELCLQKVIEDFSQSESDSDVNQPGGVE